MAITAQALQLRPGSSGGAVTSALPPAGQIVWGPGDVQQPAFVGVVQFTGDGATATGVINWIDGTQTLPFTPTAVFAYAYQGGTAAATISIQQQVTFTNVSATVTFSAAPASAATINVMVLVYR